MNFVRFWKLVRCSLVLVNFLVGRRGASTVIFYISRKEREREREREREPGLVGRGAWCGSYGKDCSPKRQVNPSVVTSQPLRHLSTLSSLVLSIVSPGCTEVWRGRSVWIQVLPWREEALKKCSFCDLVIYSFICCSVIHPSIHFYIHSFIHSFIHLSIHLSIHPFIHSFIHS